MKSSILCFIGLFLCSYVSSSDSKACNVNFWPKNHKAPARSATGRINSTAFFKKFPKTKLKLVEIGIVKDANFGTYKSGDSFGNSWLVAEESQVVGLNHKSAPWLKAKAEIVKKDGSVYRIEADRGCGCGGTVDFHWKVPFTAPPGVYKVSLSWSYPKMTDQVLEKEYSVTIENPNYDKIQEKELLSLQKEYGEDKVVVLQNGLMVDGKPYKGVRDMDLAIGGYEGMRTGIIHPLGRNIDLGYWLVNKKASYYSRLLLKFDVESLKGKQIEKAYLKMYIRQNVKYLPNKMNGKFDIFPMLKPWKAEIPYDKNKKRKTAIHVDKRGLGKGYPNVTYQAYPEKWESPLASGESDHGPKTSELLPYAEDLVPSVRADLTDITRKWLKDPASNNGIIIGNDLPKSLVGVHPGLDGKVDEYKKVAAPKLYKFLSSEEKSDSVLSPKLVIVLK